MADREALDCILVGGGLANAMIALCLKQQNPGIRLKIIERGPTLGGNHTWSFHTPDIDLENRAWIEPLIVKSWASQDVRFPGLNRTLPTRYNSITSDRLHRVVTAAFPNSILLNSDVTDVTPTHVTLATGDGLNAACVIDGRGFVKDGAWTLGYQKFLGLDVELESPSGLERPIIMDATVSQRDGYRFVYTMPFSPTHLLIEDTYYSSTASLDVTILEEHIRDYAEVQGWKISRVLRRESGVLPIVLAGDIEKLWLDNDRPDVPRSGLRAFMFHPATGYSLPDCVRVAAKIAALPQLSSSSVARCVKALSVNAWHDRAFFRRLNRFLIIAAEPHERVGVIQRFYRLPEALIRRFYACQLTPLDKARILIGRPPISVVRALQNYGEEYSPRQ
jgi:lycopene beta-cyclase